MASFLRCLSGTSLWAETEKRLQASVPSARLRRLEQVQNVRLWQRYYTERALLASELGVAPCEETLFHGTGKTPPHYIFNGDVGFDMRFCSAGMWGIANYFAAEAGYSNTDKYCFKNESGCVGMRVGGLVGVAGGCGISRPGLTEPCVCIVSCTACLAPPHG